MATHDRSQSLIIGQQWSTLAELVSSETENDKVISDKKQVLNSGNDTSMKLGRQDMGLFGFCPSRDEFSLVVCEKCHLLVKPQALKQHIESRHGPTNLSSLGNIPASALNSELGKKLLMPLPTKCLTSVETSTNSRSSIGTFKPLTPGWPMTKASLKQVSASVKMSAPLLGVTMKISPLKSIRSGNRVAPVTTTATATITTTTTTTTTTVFSSGVVVEPVTAVEKLEAAEVVSSSSFKQEAVKTDSLSAPVIISNSVQNLESTKISTLVNGPIRSVTALAALTSSASLTPTILTSAALSSAALPVTSPSIISTPVLITVTKPLTEPSSLTTKSVTSFVNTASLTKPVMITAVTSVGSGTIAVRPVPHTKSAKSPRDPKERKFLPCKDREYDANKHCGVTIPETGKQCTRSLTCKTHTLTLRRAVTGRSKSFDDLLKEHKAAKEILLKAKAEAQNATATANAAASANRVLVSPSTVNSAMFALSQNSLTKVVQDGKVGVMAGVPVVAAASVARTVSSSSSVPLTSTFVKPQPVLSSFQRFTSAAVLPTAATIKDEVSVRQESPAARLSSFPEVPSVESNDTKIHQNYLPHHPRPLATAQFAGRLSDRSCVLFSRRMDYIRAALLSALERQMNPPPHKKLCVESKLPQENQALNISQDPYEFSLLEAGGGLAVSDSLVSSPQSAVKQKSKLPLSPAAAMSTPTLTLGLPPGAIATPVTLAASSFTTLCSTSAALSSAASPSSQGQIWSVKSRDSLTSRSPSTFSSPALLSAASGLTNPSKRKRSGSSGTASGQFVTMTAGNGTLPVNPSISLSLSASTAGGGIPSAAITGIITPTSLNSQQSGNLIAIPSVNLTNSSLGQLNTATIGTARITTSSTGNNPGTAQKNIFKDINWVLTGIDPSLMNGQYVNIPGAQLAELAAGQGQTLFLNNFTASGSNCSAVSGNTLCQNSAGSISLSKSAKRSRSSGLKFHHTVANSTKMTGTGLEGLKLIPSSSLPPSAVLIDSSSLQGAVLTSMALATGATTSTLVAISTSSPTITDSSAVTGNAIQVLCPESSSSLVSSAMIVNGVANSAYDKVVSKNQQHQGHQHPSSASKSHHHHHHHHNNRAQHQQNLTVSGGALQASPSVAVPLSSGPNAQLCSSQAIFKPGSTFGLATKTVGGKLTVQPISLAFPISVNQAGLAALPSGKPQQQSQQQGQHTLLVATNATTGSDLDSATV